VREHDVSTPRKLFAVPELLVVLIAATPLLALSGSWFWPQLITLVAAIMLALLPNAPDVDIQRSIAIFRPLAPAAMLPAAWILLQIMPVPSGSLAHPIWRSAAAALAESISAHISIDLGFTLRALFGYLGLIALAFSAAVAARNRDRAETLLFALCAVTTMVALALLVLPHLATADALDDLVALVALGTVLDTVLIVRMVERSETRAQPQGGSRWPHAGMLLAGAGGVLMCLAALILSATYAVLVATLFGLAVLLLVVLIRRLALSRWTAVAVSAAVLVACCSLVVLQFPTNASASPLFRFARSDLTDAGAATLRMLSDTGWAGAGVGNYGVLAAIYRDATAVPGQSAINTIAAVLLEWGYAGALIAAVPVIQLLIVLLRGALSRGRDAFFSAGAAACLVTICSQAYCDASLTGIAVQTLAAIIAGIGLSQTVGSRIK
jgi:hypothetical protein